MLGKFSALAANGSNMLGRRGLTTVVMPKLRCASRARKPFMPSPSADNSRAAPLTGRVCRPRASHRRAPAHAPPSAVAVPAPRSRPKTAERYRAAAASAARRRDRRDRAALRTAGRRRARPPQSPEIPGHHREHGAERLISDEAAAGIAGDQLIGDESRRVLGVVVAAGCALLDLVTRLLGELAHLEGDARGVVIATRPQQLGGAAQQPATFGDGGGGPARRGGGGLREGRVQLGGVPFGKLAHLFPGGGFDGGVLHGGFLALDAPRFKYNSRGAADRGAYQPGKRPAG